MPPSRLVIPPRPSILLELQELMQQPEVDLSKIVELIKRDVSLYAILLSYVNSPWMGLRQKITSIETAIPLMGLEKVVGLMRAVLVRASLQEAPVYESFWNTATEVAGICQMLAQIYATSKTEDAYCTGMLHNAGVPVMLLNCNGYEDFLQKNLRRPANELCVRERLKFKTDHYLLGGKLAQKWKISNDVAMAIRYQPIAESVLSGSKALPAEVNVLMAILTLAKDISGEYQHYWKVDENEFNTKSVEAALLYLEITDQEYKEIKEDTISELIQSNVA